MKEIVKPLMQWYAKHARTLPWRSDPTPYHVWLSEIMLQQTRVEAVIGYYDRFLEELPDVQSLAAVSEERLLKLWEGLGYYNRARNLQKAAVQICEQYQGKFPESYEEWLALPGIGAYTAGAVTSIAFGKKEAAVDGNVYRIYTRLYADDTENSISTECTGNRQRGIAGGGRPIQSGVNGSRCFDLYSKWRTTLFCVSGSGVL